MPLATRPIVIGVQARFFRDGAAFTVPTAGTAGRAAKPGAADNGWIDLGVINEGSINPEADTIEVFAPKPGRKVLHDVVRTKAKTTIKLTLQEMSPLAFELVHRSAPLTGVSTTYTPMAVLGRKGWLELQLADQDDVIVSLGYFYVHLTVAGEVSMADGLATVPVEAMVLDSSVDGGSVGPAA